MEELVRKMIEEADRDKNYSLIEYVKDIVNELAVTVNCPSNWRDIGEELAREYDSDSWVYENLELWNHSEN